MLRFIFLKFQFLKFPHLIFSKKSFTTYKLILGIFNILDLFQIYSHVAMIYYEGCYISRSKYFNINLKYEILNNGYNCFNIY